jgi:tellurite resistance protein TerC
LIKSTYIALRRVLVLVIGVSVLVVGIIMIVTPGPAIVVIPAGLALLATEFLWARRLLDRMKETITNHTRANHTRTSHTGGNKAAKQPAADSKE